MWTYPASVFRGLAAPAILALTLVCAMSGGLSGRQAHADTTAMAVIACENLAPYLDGDESNPTTAPDLDNACLGYIPPTGVLSIASLAAALGNNDAVLQFDEIALLAAKDNNRIDQSCTYQAVVVDATVPADGCTLVVLVFVDDESPVAFDVPSGLAVIEGSGVGDFLCSVEGLTQGTDFDCNNAIPLNGDGVVAFRLLNKTATNGAVETIRAQQEAVEQSADINVSPDLRFDTDVDDDTINDDIDNCPLVANFDQANTDSLPISTLDVFAVDVTVANGDPFGDACDSDDDNDGLPDAVEAQIFPAGASHGSCTAATANTNPLISDSDGDLVLDGAECQLGSNPANASSVPVIPAVDADGDGLSDALETSIGSNPGVADSDGDGISDGVELKGYNTSLVATNTDGDVCPDDLEIASVDGNTVVNSVDMVIVAASFGQAGRPNHNINKSGGIDSADLLLLALNYATDPC